MTDAHKCKYLGSSKVAKGRDDLENEVRNQVGSSFTPCLSRDILITNPEPARDP